MCAAGRSPQRAACNAPPTRGRFARPIAHCAPPASPLHQGVNDYGGGAVSAEDTPFIMSNGRIENASTAGSGGAIRAEAATINMTRCAPPGGAAGGRWCLRACAACVTG